MRAGRLDGLCLPVDEDRQQRAATVLREVAYVVEAHFEMTAKAGPDDNPGKHLDTFNRRARRGQCFHQPCLGCREFPASFALIEPDEPLPEPDPTLCGERDLGWMLLDIDYAADNASRFFRAVMRDGVIEVPRMTAGGTAT
jgi:CRISPR-associated protein Cas5d